MSAAPVALSGSAKPRHCRVNFTQGYGWTSRVVWVPPKWLEDFIQQMCRIKNPDLYNIGKSGFLLKAAIEGLTDNSTHRGMFPEHIRTFRNAMGFDDL